MSDGQLREDTIALTGVTGSLGRQLLSELAKRNPKLRVIAIAREPGTAQRDPGLSPLLSLLGPRLQWIQADLVNLELKSVDRARLSEASSLWHLAACTALHPRACPTEIQRVNTSGTHALLRLVEALPCPLVFHYVSTAYVAGCREGLVTEAELDEGQEHRNAYERSKLEAEGLVRRWIGEGGQGFIYRPSLIVEEKARPSCGNIASVFARLVAQAAARGESALTLRLPPTAAINVVPCHWAARTMADLAERAPLQKATCFHLTAQADTRLEDVLSSVAAAHPHFAFRFRPELPSEALGDISRLLDCALHDLKGYLEAPLRFDRRNTTAILGGRFTEPNLDLTRRAAEALDRAG